MDQEQNTTPGGTPMGETKEVNTFPSEGGSGKSDNMMLIVGGIVVVIIILLLGWLMMGTNNPEMPPQGGALETTSTVETQQSAFDNQADTAAASLSTQGTSDELGAIEMDANATDLKALDNIENI